MVGYIGLGYMTQLLESGNLKRGGVDNNSTRYKK